MRSQSERAGYDLKKSQTIFDDVDLMYDEEDDGKLNIFSF
jgi:hypothetical protein